MLAIDLYRSLSLATTRRKSLDQRHIKFPKNCDVLCLGLCTSWLHGGRRLTFEHPISIAIFAGGLSGGFCSGLALPDSPAWNSSDFGNFNWRQPRPFSLDFENETTLKSRGTRLAGLAGFEIAFGISTLFLLYPLWMKLTHLAVAHLIWIHLVLWVRELRYLSGDSSGNLGSPSVKNHNSGTAG